MRTLNFRGLRLIVGNCFASSFVVKRSSRCFVVFFRRGDLISLFRALGMLSQQGYLAGLDSRVESRSPVSGDSVTHLVSSPPILVSGNFIFWLLLTLKA